MFYWDDNEFYKNRPSWWFLEGFTDYIHSHPSMREGYARYHMYSNLPVYLKPEDQIVGNLNKSIYNEVIFNNVGSQVLNKEVLQRFMDQDDISAAEKQEVQKRVNLMEPFMQNDMEERLPEHLKAVSKSSAGASTYFNGHVVFDYEQILTIGLNGYRKRLVEYMNAAGEEDGFYFYRGLLLALEGMQIYIEKHAQMAEYCLAHGLKDYDRQRLTEIKRICGKIGKEPPETLAEALQLVWFIFCFGDYDSYGRFDQYMYSFYQKELNNSGDSVVKNLIVSFLKKGEENKGILNMTLGGKNADGSCAVTEFTYLVMDIIRELGYKSPNLCLRLSGDSDERLYKKAHENLATGQAIPALYNDDVIIPILLELGYPPEDANTYCLAGCSQVVIPAKSNLCCDVGVYNALKILEITLHEGVDVLQNKQAGKSQRPIRELESFEAFYQVYLDQMRYLIDCGIEINAQDIISREQMPASVRTLFIGGCLENGKSIYQGGAVYNGVQNEVIGLTNVANAMLVIKKLVFEQRRFSLEELVEIADKNFEGYEKLRKEIIQKIPKFGNDIEEADEMRILVGKDFYEYMGSKEGTLGGKQWPGEVVFQSHINLAPFTKASLDGRKDFEPLADSAGAMRGTDLQGPTALINSICKIPVTAPTVSRNLNIRFPKHIFGTEPEKIIALFRTFMKQKGVQMQINVLDKEELLQAKEQPDQYRNLIVRIGGYNDYFVDIPPEMQDEVIARTEQELS